MSRYSKYCFPFVEDDPLSNSSNLNGNIMVGIYQREIRLNDQNETFICSAFHYLFEILKQKMSVGLKFNIIQRRKNILKHSTVEEELYLLQNGTIDFLAHELTYDEERSKVVDYMQLMPNGKLISILSSPKLMLNNNMFTIFRSFETEVWILLVLSYWIIFYLNSIKTDYRKLKLFIAIDYLIILTGKGVKLTFYHNKYLLILWTFTSFLMYNFFLSDIHAVIVTNKEVRIETIQQLIDRREMKIFVSKDNYPHKILIKDFNALAKRIKHPKQKYSLKIVSQLIKHRYVLISSQFSNIRMLNHYSQFNLIETGEDIYQSFIGIAVRKSFEQKLRLRLESLCKLVHQSGFYRLHYNEEINRLKKLNEFFNVHQEAHNFPLEAELESSHFNTVLKLENLFFSFILIPFGFIISFISLVFDVLNSNKQKLKNRLILTKK